MNDFSFYNPTKVLFGNGKIKSIGEEVKLRSVKKVLLHYGKSSIFKNGVYDEIIASLKANNIEVVELGGVKPNPVYTLVKEAIELCRKDNIDGIIAAGGGSVIDSAKAIAAGCKYDGDVWDFYEGKARPAEALPLFVVLTLSATGSEMNAGTVVTKEDENKKWAFGAPGITHPAVSIIDPSVQATLPVNQTVNGAVDTMSHVFELYFDGTKNTDFQDRLSESIIKTTMEHVQVLIKEPGNYNSRAELAWCSTMALNGINGVGRAGGDWSTHMIEHSVSAFYDIAHGAGLAILFPAWMLYVYQQMPRKFARFGREIFGLEGNSDLKVGVEAINKLKDFYRSIGAPVTLQEVGVKEEDLIPMAENATIRQPLGKLKPLYTQDVLNIYKIAYK